MVATRKYQEDRHSVTDFSQDDARAVARIIENAAIAHVLPYFRAPDKVDIREKTGPGDLVTAADLACERALTDALGAHMPGSVIVGEEAVSTDASALERLKGSAPVWIIDPVDGTANFARGTRIFAVIVALVVEDETIAGWIYDPLSERMSHAVKGLGCYTQEVLIRPPRRVAPMALNGISGAISSRFCDKSLGRRLRERIRALRTQVCLGSAGQEYLHLIDGDLHATLYHRLMPWDHAAGVLMFRETGGYSAVVPTAGPGPDYGIPYSPYRSIEGGALLNAPDPETWRLLRDHLFADDGEREEDA